MSTTLLVILCNTLVTNTVCVLLVSVMLSKLQCYCVQWKVWWCKDKDDKGSTGNTTLSCNMRCIACQYPEPKTNQYSMYWLVLGIPNIQSLKLKTQYPRNTWCIKHPMPPETHCVTILNTKSTRYKPKSISNLTRCLLWIPQSPIL